MASGARKDGGEHSAALLLLLSVAEHTHYSTGAFGLCASSTTTSHILGADSLENNLGVQLHYYALIYQLVNNQNDTRHVVDETFPLDVVLEHLVKAVMDSVQNRGENQLVVILTIPEDVDGHVGVAPEHSYVVINVHDVVLVHVKLSSSFLFVRFRK